MSTFSSILRKNLPLLVIAFALLSSLLFLEYGVILVRLDNEGTFPLPTSFLCEAALPRNLRYGDQGEGVTRLQTLLNLSEGTKISENGNFDTETLNAVKKFQEKYTADILVPVGLREGSGFVGSSTRTKLSKLCLAYAATVRDEAPDKPTKPSTKSYLSLVWTTQIFLIMVLGLNFTLWGMVGLVRLVAEKVGVVVAKLNGHFEVENQIKEDEVAVIVPAHNEELVINDTLLALLNIVKPTNIFVISDGSSDRTAEIARSHGVNVLELNPGRGKAGALESAFLRFKISQRYKVVTLVDADTRLKHDYFKKALPFFNDSGVVAVAGYASTMWHREKLSWKQILFVLHRDRIYFLFQTLIKFGQTWKYANVTHIVPGFASTYRTSVLKYINMNPPGLVIEDFNMTFEVHHKKLGRIAHHPSVVAYTQDPDNVRDYYRQIKRWHLGFWQTVRLHGFWLSKFWAFMAITLVEVILGSLVFLLAPFFILAYLLLTYSHIPSIWPWHFDPHYFLLGFVVTWISDYILTIIVAVVQKRKEYLIVGPFFPLIRFLDGIAFLLAIPRAFLIKSTGRWISPSRRAI